MGSGAIVRGKRVGAIPVERPPFCSWQPEEISLLALRAKLRRSQEKPTERASSTPASGTPGKTTPRPLKLPRSPPRFDDTPLPSEQNRRIPVAILNIAMGLAIAVAVGLAVSYSGAFKLQLQQEGGERTQLAALPQALPAPTILAPPGNEMQPSRAAPAASSGDKPASRPLEIAPAPALPATQATRKKRKPKAVQLNARAGKSTPRSVGKPAQSNKKKRTRPTPSLIPQPDPFADDMPSLTRRARPSTRVAIAQCQREESIIGRERCMWRICSRRWGKDGCPRYDQNGGQPLVGLVTYPKNQSAASLPHN